MNYVPASQDMCPHACAHRSEEECADWNRLQRELLESALRLAHGEHCKCEVCCAATVPNRITLEQRNEQIQNGNRWSEQLVPLETLEAIGIELAQLIASKERHDMTSIRLLVHLRELRDRIKRVVDNTRGTRAPEQKEEKAHGIKS